MTERSAPVYSRAEEICNSASHALGAVLALGGTVLLVAMALMSPAGDDSGQSVADMAAARESYAVCALVYGASVFLMFLISALYHAVRDPKVKAIVRKADHAMIYFMIAGTYVPILNDIASPREAAVWYCGLGLCAVLGAVFSFITLKHKFVTTAIYLVMGWASLLLLRNLWRAAEPFTTYLLVTGGVTYSIGAALYLIRKPFMHAVFHIFVLGGAVLQYFAICTLYIYD